MQPRIRAPRRQSVRSAAAVARGLVALLLATTALPALASPASAAAWRDYIANCDVNLRASASMSAAVLTTIPLNTTVTVNNEVSGDSWSASCPGAVSGNRWFAIVYVGSSSAQSLFGVSPVYAAAGLFRAANVLEGIDVSTWQGAIDYGKVKAAGKSFVVAKATEGIGFTDPKWSMNRTNAAANGLAVTGYHFARPDLNPTNPTGEADWFASQLALAPGMLVPALDLEVSGGLSSTALIAWVQAWLDEVYAKTGARAMIYTSPSFWSNRLANTSTFADQGYTVLWIAHWFVSAPTVPANNWGGHGWTFWQYDDCGSVPGISGCVDLDRFNGLDMTRVTYGADFSVASSPGSLSVEQGASSSLSVTLGRSWFTLPVSLSVTGLPSGVSASLSPTSTSGTSASLAFSTSSSSTPAGTYPITITGSANGVTRSSTTTLTVTDSLPPTVVARLDRLFAPSTIGTGTPVRSTWSATDASGVAGYQAQRQVDGGAWASLASGSTTGIVESLVFGHSYRDRVAATDSLGNTSAWTYGPTYVPLLMQQTSTSVTYTGSWWTSTSTSASGGSTRYSLYRGATATLKFNGAAVSWVTYRGPTRGSASVYVDGVYRGTVSLYAKTYSARQTMFTWVWPSGGTHTIRIVNLGTAGHSRVDVDAFVRFVQL